LEFGFWNVNVKCKESENIRKTMEASGLHGIVDCMSKWMSRKYFPHTDVSKVIETPIVKEENGKK
jgi:hypothetical protein